MSGRVSVRVRVRLGLSRVMIVALVRTWVCVTRACSIVLVVMLVVPVLFTGRVNMTVINTTRVNVKLLRSRCCFCACFAHMLLSMFACIVERVILCTVECMIVCAVRLYLCACGRMRFCTFLCMHVCLFCAYANSP